MKSLLSAEFRFMFPSPVTKDSSGNRLKEEFKDPQQVLTKALDFHYDILGRLWRIEDRDHYYTEYSYDALGNRRTFKDPKGNPLTYSYYDPLSRLEEVILPGDIHTLYDYDFHDNLTSVTDGNGNTTNYVLDDMGRVYRQISPDTGTTTYEYDQASNVIAKTDARTIRITYEYDALNRCTFTDFPSPTEPDILYTYDNCTYGQGRLCRVVDQAAATDNTYSPRGELVQEDKLILGITYTTGYKYDANGNLEVLTYPSGRTVTYVYDNADQVTDVLTTPLGGAEQTVASSVSYYPFGPVKSMTHGNGLVRNVGYDLQYRINSIQTGTGPDFIQKFVYTPDPNGNIDFIQDELDSGNDKDFSYSALDRLEGATGPWGTLGWTYDNVGNRLTYSDSSGTTNYNYFAGTNKLAALSGATVADFTYDTNGNTETEGARQFNYNENNRLTQVNDGSVIGEYSYNFRNQRVAKTVGSEVAVFHYGKTGHIIAVSSLAGVVVSEYIYFNEQIVAKTNGLDLLHIQTDHSGTPVVMTDANSTPAVGECQDSCREKRSHAACS